MVTKSQPFLPVLTEPTSRMLDAATLLFKGTVTTQTGTVKQNGLRGL